jgi:carboxyl-terminal processing protease
MFDELVAYAVKNGVKTDDNGIAASKEIIKTYLKAFIGRNIFDDEAFYPVIQKEDKTLLKAITVLDTLK